MLLIRMLLVSMVTAALLFCTMIPPPHLAPPLQSVGLYVAVGDGEMGKGNVARRDIEHAGGVVATDDDLMRFPVNRQVLAQSPVRWPG